MKTSYHSKGGASRSGGKSYGGGAGSRGGFGASRGGFKPRGGAGGFDRPELHDATCAGCGKDCQVPFKPNGSKPVFCRNCFKKDDSNFAPKRFEKPVYGAKRAESRFEVNEDDDFGGRSQPARASAGGGADTARIEARLASIEAKLDMLIDSVTIEEDDEEESDKKSKE